MVESSGSSRAWRRLFGRLMSLASAALLAAALLKVGAGPLAASTKAPQPEPQAVKSGADMTGPSGDSLGFLALGNETVASNLGAGPDSVNVSTVVSLAQANIGKGYCDTNSLGGAGFGANGYSSCQDVGEWCADFLMWLWANAGVTDLTGLTSGAGSFYTYGQAHGTWSQTPAVGDAVVFNYNGAGYADHVAVVTQVGNGTITTVSGNAGGGNGWVEADGTYSSTYGSTASGQRIDGYIAPAGGGGGNSCNGPSLNSPNDGDTLTSETITFSWNALSGCTFNGYTLRVRADTNFDGDVSGHLIDTGVGGTSDQVTIPSGHQNQTLYWAVKAANAPNGASWSYRSFTIVPPPSGCSGPSLNSPNDGDTLTSETITFSWNALSGCTFNGYTLRVRADTNFDGDVSGHLIDTGVGGTSDQVTIPSGHQNQTLYWAVKAANAPNGASWSYRSFTIVPGGSVVFSDDFSSYSVGQMPPGWLRRGTTGLTPTIQDVDGSGPAFQVMQFPEVSWQYWNCWMIKDHLSLGSEYTVTSEVDFQNSVADKADITVGWKDTTGDGIHIEPDIYGGDIEFHASANNGQPLSGVTVTGSATQSGGLTISANTIYVKALDAYGNAATGYRGTVHFTSSDAKAILPADYTFTSGDAGVHTFPYTQSPGLTLKSAGAQWVRATDKTTGSTTGSQTVTVTPAAAATLVVSGLTTPRTAGTPGTITVKAVDAYGNTATGYTGTVHFTSTDAKAILPANYTFTAANAGVHTFSVTLKTVGTQVIRARDTVTSTITGTQTIVVS